MDFTLNFCEYNRSNSDYDRIFRPEGSGDFLFLLFKTPMKVYLGGQCSCSKFLSQILKIVVKNFSEIVPGKQTQKEGFRPLIF